MSENPQTIVQFLDTWLGGAATTLFGAFTGRLMWHATEVRKGRRKMLGKEIIWETPIAVGMGLVGEGLARWFGLDHTISTALVAFMAYLGPRGAEVLFQRWFDKKID